MPNTLTERKAMMDEASASSPRAREQYPEQQRASNKGADGGPLSDETPENPVIEQNQFRGR